MLSKQESLCTAVPRAGSAHRGPSPDAHRAGGLRPRGRSGDTASAKASSESRALHAVPAQGAAALGDIAGPCPSQYVTAWGAPRQKSPCSLSGGHFSRERNRHAGSLKELQCPWVNCRELCLQTPLSISQQAPGEPLCKQPGWEFRAEADSCSFSTDVCCLVEEAGGRQFE